MSTNQEEEQHEEEEKGEYTEQEEQLSLIEMMWLQEDNKELLAEDEVLDVKSFRALDLR